MQTSDFEFELPESLIAQYPSAGRSDSRLLVLDGNTGETQDRQFRDFVDFLQDDDLLVFNNTKVIPARLKGVKDSGGQVEVLVERILDDQRVLAHVRSNKALQPGRRLTLETMLTVEVVGRQSNLYELRFETDTDLVTTLERHGRMPLPPYIQREVDKADESRYQTVYAKHPGAVAAPTAGLHFDDSCLEKLKARGIQTAEITLHVGAGTFQPVRVDDIREHHMHAEQIEVPASVSDAVKATHARGGRVIAVGTTSVRALESASINGQIAPFFGETDIFIYPGYRFKSVDAMFTNFHLSGSTLMMLVSAFAGRERILAAYQHAIDQQYRFFSYGDAMFMTRKTDV